MLKIENVVLPSPEQWEAVIRGMRNPMNSWHKSDSYATHIGDDETLETASYEYFIGDEDLALATHLARGGSVHGKFRRMIPVYLDITAPLYWWKEFDTYKIGTVANSCSTMHKIHSKPFRLDDFSAEKLIVEEMWNENEIDDVTSPRDTINHTIIMLNQCRKRFLETNDKKYWWQMIQLLPSSYNQKRTVMLNYEVLSQIYLYRRDHKLDEWHTFCDWIDQLPYFNEIIK